MWRNCDQLPNSKSVWEPYLDKNGARCGDGGADKAEALEAADPEDEHPVHLGGPGARNPGSGVGGRGSTLWLDIPCDVSCCGRSEFVCQCAAICVLT